MKNNSSRFASKLFACWHPVSYCSEVTKKPFATKLLDEPLVIWRGKDGQVYPDTKVNRIATFISEFVLIQGSHNGLGIT